MDRHTRRYFKSLEASIDVPEIPRRFKRREEAGVSDSHRRLSIAWSAGVAAVLVLCFALEGVMRPNPMIHSIDTALAPYIKTIQSFL